MAPPKSYSVQAIEAPCSVLGEAPHWDVRTQSIYYVDIFAKDPTILRYSYNENKTYSAIVSKYSEKLIKFLSTMFL